MIALIDQYRTELEKINAFAASTIETYTIGVKAFCHYAKTVLHIDPATAKADHLLQWLLHLKHSGIAHSRLENHHYSLKSFFAFVHKTGLTDSNPANVLPLLIHRRRERTHPINGSDAFRLLHSFDRNSWTGLWDYTLVSILWALGLRTSELTGLNVRDFKPAHGKRTGLLRIRGKNKKQRALFVVDRLFDQLVEYLAHPQSPRKKLAPMFPADTRKTAISNSRVQRIVKDHLGVKSSFDPF
jgi:site-specific recombinase XerD